MRVPALFLAVLVHVSMAAATVSPAGSPQAVAKADPVTVAGERQGTHMGVLQQQAQTGSVARVPSLRGRSSVSRRPDIHPSAGTVSAVRLRSMLGKQAHGHLTRPVNRRAGGVLHGTTRQAAVLRANGVNSISRSPQMVSGASNRSMMLPREAGKVASVGGPYEAEAGRLGAQMPGSMGSRLPQRFQIRSVGSGGHQ